MKITRWAAVLTANSLQDADKLDTSVAFPLTLDSSTFCLHPDAGAPNTYSLAAVSNHFGGTGGGHYTASARCGETGNASLQL